MGLPAFPLAFMIVWLTERRLGIKASQVSPVVEVGKIAPRPLLIMHGESDRLVPHHNSERLFEAAGQPKDLWLIPELGHAHGALVVGVEYEGRLRSFFDANLKDSPTTDAGSPRKGC